MGSSASENPIDRSSSVHFKLFKAVSMVRLRVRNYRVVKLLLIRHMQLRQLINTFNFYDFINLEFLLDKHKLGCSKLKICRRKFHGAN